MCNEPTIKVPIMAYHQVMPAQNLPPDRAGLVVDARSFRWQMWLLRLLGFRAVSLAYSRPYHSFSTGCSLPAKRYNLQP
jgi:hypothetical protein